jgi:uncharacterized protein (DUF1015 family)
LARIAAFSPLRFNPERTSFISRLVAPPFDVIDQEEAKVLRALDPHNVVRLTLGKEPPAGRADDDYAEAGRALAQWRSDGVLVPDPEPSIYVCQQRFAIEGLEFARQGLICALLLEELGRGGILPHEQTMAGPKADRLRLMEACGANLSQVFGMFSDDSGRVDALVGELAEGLPICEFQALDGVVYKLWRISDRDAISEAAALLRDEVMVIADGHHRYETALRYRDAHRPAGRPIGSAAEDFAPVYGVSVRNAGLKALPTHRLVKAQGKFDPEALLRQVGECFGVERVAIQGLPGLAEALGERPDESCIGCLLPPDLLCWLHPGERVGERVPARMFAWRGLPVTQLHYAILEPMLDIPTEQGAAHPRLAFEQDLERAFWDTASGRFDVAFLLPPIEPRLVETIARAGERMPPKATYFYPKMLAGLALYPFDVEPPVPPHLA